MSRSRRGKKAGEDAERLLQEAFGVSEDQLLKDFILAQTEVKDSDIPPGSEDGFERLMAKLEAEVGTSPESEKESSSENIVKLHEEARKPRRLKSIVKVSVAAAAIAADGKIVVQLRVVVFLGGGTVVSGNPDVDADF